MIDGVLYNISAWDITTAYEAATGKVLWTFDPKIAPEWARLACCGPVSRGLAAWHGNIIIAALDGRLIALDAEVRQACLDHADHREGTTAVAHGRAAHRRRTSGHRQRRRRLRRARLYIGLRRAHRQADLEVLHRAGRSGSNAGRRGVRLDHAHGRQDLVRANGGRSAAAATTGMPSFTIPSSIWSTSAPATARLIRRNSAAPAAATICSCAPSWR